MSTRVISPEAAGQHLQRSLTSGQLSMIAIGGAIGTGLFLGSAFAIQLAGPAVLLSYGIAAVIALLLMGCLAEMTIAHPISGSFGAFAGHYLGPLAGFLVRYCYWSGTVLGVGTEVTAVAVYMRLWFPSVPGLLWILLFASALVGMNALQVGVYGTLEYSFSLIKILAIVAFLLLAGAILLFSPHASGMGLHLYTVNGGFFPLGFRGMWAAVLVAIFSYFGVEMIAVAAGEARDPRRAITSAFRSTAIRLILFYLLTIGVMLAIVPWNLAGTTTSPFVRVMQVARIPYAAGILNLVVLIAALSAMNSQLYVTSRMLLSLARAGYAPAALGRLSRAGVPVPALLVSSAGIVVAAVMYTLYSTAAFSLIFSISIFGALFAWLMIFVTHLAFRRRHRATPGDFSADATGGFRMFGTPWTSMLGAALLLAVLITSAFTPGFRSMLLYGIPFLALLTVLYWLRAPKTCPDADLSTEE
jgi:L-asparagine transporter-like permease